MSAEQKPHSIRKALELSLAAAGSAGSTGAVVLCEEALRDLDNLEEQLEVLREFFDAFEEVEGGIADFDLHNEAVMRMRAAREAVYALTSNPASRLPYPSRHGSSLYDKDST